MHVLITGAGGFIGGHMVAASLAQHHIVTATYRHSPVILPGGAARHDRLQTLCCDLNELKSLPHDLDAIIHIAGLRESATASDEKFVRDNVEATQNLVDLATISGIRQFVFTSSVAVTAPPGDATISESTPPHPCGVYGRTKLESERCLLRADPEMKRLIIRLPAVLGVGAHGGFLPNVVRKVRSGDIIPLFNPQHRFNRAVHVSDLAKMALSALNSTSIQMDTVVLGAAEPISLETAIQNIIDVTNSSSRIVDQGERNPAPLLDYQAATRRYAYNPFSLRAMLDMYVTEECQVR